MTKLNQWRRAATFFVLCIATAIAAHAQTFNTLMNFDGANGVRPNPLDQGTDGAFYGTTTYGGANGVGTIFRVTTAGAFATLYSFLCTETNCGDGDQPFSGLILASDGNSYGATSAGAYGTGGTIFRFNPANKLMTLHTFDIFDGASPQAGLLQAFDGSLYGTTTSGGAKVEFGTVFKISPGGAFTTLYSFCAKTNCTDGAYPYAVMVQGPHGDLHGTTAGGGIRTATCGEHGCGTVFRISTAGKLSTLYRFSSPGGWGPYAGLIQATDGNLYGTTALGGNSNCSGGCGTIFKISPGDALTTLYDFSGPDGDSPVNLIQATDGNLYGTTGGGGANGSGTVFEISPDGMLTTLHSFDIADGQGPAGPLQATNGSFYGVTQGGGTAGDGTVFSLSTGLGPFVAFVRGSGKIGQTGGILGQGLTGTTSVAINGTSATFTVVSDTFIEATVPAGATTGYVTVTTPSGTLTSNVPFRVIP
jgi:uncharacterized repeat protein (TIGR03803 family)